MAALTKKAQNGIEYLLILGVVILIVAMVVLTITGVIGGGQAGVTVGQNTLATASNQMLCQKDINSMGSLNAPTASVKACQWGQADYNKPNCTCCKVFTTTQLQNCS